MIGWDHYDEYELIYMGDFKKKKLMGEYYRNMETKTSLFDKYGLRLSDRFFYN